MKRISKKIKYDFTIYICLILALVLIGYSGYSYLDSQSYSLKDLITPEKEIVIEKEPQELKDLNKKDEHELKKAIEQAQQQINILNQKQQFHTLGI